MRRFQHDGETPGPRHISMFAWMGAALSSALAVAGWVILDRGPDSMVPLGMGITGLVFGVLAYRSSRWHVLLVAVLGNALLVLIIAMWAFSLWRGGELGWSTEPPIP